MTAALTGGFADPPRTAARAFRAALEALSRPGRILDVAGAAPPAPLSVAAGVLLLTLADRTAPVHLAGRHDTADVRDWLAFHTGAPLAPARDAAFAVGTWDALQPLDRFPIGLPAYPDRSATLIVEVPALTADGALLRGPGIAGTARLPVPDPAAFRANRALFPLGLDVFLTCGNALAGLPRTTIVEDA
jgi:alpha-D-ribose 1-methylphosphonate 5-triphosphate synthase subunit PhnH